MVRTVDIAPVHLFTHAETLEMLGNAEAASNITVVEIDQMQALFNAIESLAQDNDDAAHILTLAQMGHRLAEQSRESLDSTIDLAAKHRRAAKGFPADGGAA